MFNLVRSTWILCEARGVSSRLFIAPICRLLFCFEKLWRKIRACVRGMHTAFRPSTLNFELKVSPCIVRFIHHWIDGKNVKIRNILPAVSDDELISWVHGCTSTRLVIWPTFSEGWQSSIQSESCSLQHPERIQYVQIFSWLPRGLDIRDHQSI